MISQIKFTLGKAPPSMFNTDPIIITKYYLDTQTLKNKPLKSPKYSFE